MRERLILALVCAIILVMGVASPLFTTRTEESMKHVLRQMERPGAYLAQPVGADLRVRPTSAEPRQGAHTQVRPYTAPPEAR